MIYEFWVYALRPQHTSNNEQQKKSPPSWFALLFGFIIEIEEEKKAWDTKQLQEK